MAFPSASCGQYGRERGQDQANCLWAGVRQGLTSTGRSGANGKPTLSLAEQEPKYFL